MRSEIYSVGILLNRTIIRECIWT